MTICNPATCRPVRRAHVRLGYRFRPSAFLPQGPHLAKRARGGRTCRKRTLATAPSMG
jgi:hypothetical protein